MLIMIEPQTTHKTILPLQKLQGNSAAAEELPQAHSMTCVLPASHQHHLGGTHLQANRIFLWPNEWCGDPK